MATAYLPTYNVSLLMLRGWSSPNPNNSATLTDIAKASLQSYVGTLTGYIGKWWWYEFPLHPVRISQNLVHHSCWSHRQRAFTTDSLSQVSYLASTNLWADGLRIPFTDTGVRLTIRQSGLTWGLDSGAPTALCSGARGVIPSPIKPSTPGPTCTTKGYIYFLRFLILFILFICEFICFDVLSPGHHDMLIINWVYFHPVTNLTFHSCYYHNSLAFYLRYVNRNKNNIHLIIDWNDHDASRCIRYNVQPASNFSLWLMPSPFDRAINTI